MIDIHSHILPGIDDGAYTMDDSLDMLQMAAESGVSTIVATPHCNIPGLYDNYFDQYYIEKIRELRAAVKEERIPIQILPGMEAFATYNLPQLLIDKKIMPLNQSRYVLMEFDFGEDPDYANDMVLRMKEIGAYPVIAHVERYQFVQDNPQIIYDWRMQGAIIQVNKSSFMGSFGRAAMHTAYRLLAHNLVSVIASDAHGADRRTPYMRDVYRKLSEEYKERYLDVLFRENPARICMNRPIIKFKMTPFTGEDSFL